jgi:diacylglycerol kinase family enzyme
MRLTLIHNAVAGNEQPSPEQLIALGRNAGYRVRYQDAHAEEFARVLDEPADVVLVAGGDGTVAKVAKHLVGRDVPLAVLPLGTANNIALTFEIRGSARDIMEGLSESTTTPMDVARATAPWGSRPFIEAAGTGFFAGVLRDVHDREARTDVEQPTTPVEDAARRMLRALDAYRPVRRHVLADGEDLSGRYLLVEAMNIRSIGPRMVLAPDAHPGDGYLDLVLVRETDRRAFAEYLGGIADGAERVSPFETRRVRRISFVWDSAHGHLDDEPWPAEGGGDSAPVVDVEIVDPPILVLVPAFKAMGGAGRFR